MAEPEILFEINAALILAKLHLGGCESITLWRKAKGLFINTGIKNDNQDAKPENPGKVEFDLNNLQGQYEVGYANYIEYENLFEILHVLEDMAALQAKLANKKLLDPAEDKEDLKNLFSDEDKDRIEEILSNVGIKLDFDDENAMQKAIDELKKKIEEDKKDYEEKLEKAKDNAFNCLMAYMTLFVGIDKAKQLSKDSLVKIDISESIKDSNDKNLVKNYEIVAIDEKEKAILLKKFEADPSHCRERVCFKTGYAIQLEK